MAAVVARGSVLLTPKFDNFESTVKDAVDRAFAGTAAQGREGGRKASDGFASGFAGGAIGATVAQVAQRAFDAISSSIGAAVQRVDTMNNFPKVMSALGYSADDAEVAIGRMADAVQGLPTSLDGLASMTQQVAPLTGSMEEATDISIALNNALLAGGKGPAAASRAMEQYTQVLSKGRPDLQDWKTLQEVMPGQLNQVAQALLGPTANSRDLYAALKDGRLGMDDFNAAIVQLNTQGVDGFASFEQQARDATGGIGTAVDNVKNRIAMAIGKIIDAIGPENISGAINAFSSTFSGIGDAVAGVVDFVKEHIGVIGPVVGGVVSAFAGLKVIGMVPGLLGALSGPLSVARNGFVALRLSTALVGPLGALKAGLGSVGKALMGVMGGPVGVAVAAIAALVTAFVVAYNTSDEFRAVVQDAFQRIQEVAAQVWPYVEQAIKTVCDVVQGAAQEVWPSISEAIGAACQLVQAVVQAAWPYVQAIVQGVMDVIQFVVTTVWPVVVQAFQSAATVILGVIQAVWPLVSGIIQTVMGAIKAVIDVVLGIIQGDWDAVWGAVGNLVSVVWDGIVSTVSNLINAVLGVIDSVLGAIRGLWDSAWTAIKSFVVTAWDGIKQGVSNGIDAVVGFVRDLPGNILNALGNLGDLLVNAGKSVIDGFLRGLKGAWDGVTGFIGGIGDWIVEHKGPPAYDAVMLVDNGSLIMQGLLAGMERAWGGVEGFVTSRASVIGDAMGDAVAAANDPRRWSASARAQLSVGVGRYEGAGGGDTATDAARMVIAALPSIIANNTPVMGHRDLRRAVQEVV